MTPITLNNLKTFYLWDHRMNPILPNIVINLKRSVRWFLRLMYMLDRSIGLEDTMTNHFTPYFFLKKSSPPFFSINKSSPFVDDPGPGTPKNYGSLWIDCEFTQKKSFVLSRYHLWWTKGLKSMGYPGQNHQQGLIFFEKEKGILSFSKNLEGKCFYRK